MSSVLEQLPRIAESTYKKVLHTIEPAVVSWVNIFELDWDVCIILDACRYDLFQTLADDYEYIHGNTSFTSADSMTPRWMERTFTDDVAAELKDTAYICGNPFAEDWVATELLERFEPVYQYGWDDDIGTVLPQQITDAAIRIGREGGHDRMLIHYMQPHVPFVDWEDRTPLTRGNFSLEDPGRPDTWERLKSGEVDIETVKAAYRENLKLVLNRLDVLVENIDADKAVLTSDHGNGYGEWGIYGHPMHIPFQSVREVPWAEVAMADTDTHDPKPASEPIAEQDLEKQLRALGYQ